MAGKYNFQSPLAAGGAASSELMKQLMNRAQLPQETDAGPFVGPTIEQAGGGFVGPVPPADMASVRKDMLNTSRIPPMPPRMPVGPTDMGPMSMAPAFGSALPEFMRSQRVPQVPTGPVDRGAMTAEPAYGSALPEFMRSQRVPQMPTGPMDRGAMTAEPGFGSSLQDFLRSMRRTG